MLENLPIEALYGGILIGLSAALLLAFNGRIAGISGILYNLLFNNLGDYDRNWRLAFLIGLLVGGYALLPVDFALREGYSGLLLALSGLAVGIGTRIGNGCTSGHGVCGIGLLAGRSIVATLIFMGAGIITVTLLRIMSI
ncbi:MAG: YeeE/YedE family protein [Gammaproteobacteria bacterium]|nr:YeeE/YedE family protein [Gammaproteobacteria bacterium]MDP6165949.1 YeeE/YedE family protein [Gammaproteobacteria bacterium]